MANVTNPYLFRIVRNLCDVTVLRWINSKGAYEVFPFTGIPSTDTENLENPTLQTETQRNTLPLAKPSREVVTLRAGNLTHGQYRGLQGLFTSPRVYIIHPRNSGLPAEPVYVLPGTFTTDDVFEMTHEVEFKIQTKFINALTN